MIPFLDLKRSYQAKKREIDKAVAEVLSSGLYLGGPQLGKFEEEFSSYLEVKEAVGVGSGTDAIILALQSLGINPEDEIVIPANVYPSIFGVIQSGATPVLCDVDPITFNLNVENLRKITISKKTKAILFVHLYGNSVGIIEVAEFARKNKLLLVEDCAHAQGAKINNKHTGTFGHAGCFSFYPTKNL